MSPRRFAVPVLAMFVAACGSGSQEPGPADYSMAGHWRHSADFRDSTTGDSHIDEGQFDLQSTGTGFSGSGWQQGICATAHGSTYQGPLADPTPYPVSDGAVSGMTVSFKTNLCEYTGTFENGNPNRITGSGRCTYASNGVTYHFAGLWQADRLR